MITTKLMKIAHTSMADSPTIGNAVLEWRQFRGLSLTALSNRSGLSKGYISQLEHNKIRQPNDEYLAKLADALGIEVAELASRRMPPTLNGTEDSDEAVSTTELAARSIVDLTQTSHALEYHEAEEIIVGKIYQLLRNPALPNSRKAQHIETLLSFLSWLEFRIEDDLSEGINVGTTYTTSGLGAKRGWRNTVSPKRSLVVFTRDGDLRKLPADSTPIDFAYAIHTDLGHRCRGAKINDREVPLNYVLQNGDRVEIITAKHDRPKLEWLDFVRTKRARAEIRAWFRRQNHKVRVTLGRQLLDRELTRLELENEDYELLSKLLHYEKVEDLFSAIGVGELNPRTVATRALELRRKQETAEVLFKSELSKNPLLNNFLREDDKTGSSKAGKPAVTTRVAACCQPLPGDRIVGLLTNRGITIHSNDCLNILNMAESERLIEIDWSDESRSNFYPVMITVHAKNRVGLLRDVVNVISGQGVDMDLVNAVTYKDSTAQVTATLEVTDANQLNRILDQILCVDDVREARRQKPVALASMSRN